MTAPTTVARPTKARYTVLLFAFLAAVITYLDRICISAAAPLISKDLRLSSMEMGYVFSTFGLFYMLFELPSGRLGDHWGQRRTLTRIVTCWSIFTMLTGAVWSYASLLTTRAIFGAAEAGAFPTLSRSLARWFPRAERSAANGVMWMGARVGGALAPALAVLLISSTSWRAAFAIFGSTGLIWSVFFWRWYRDDPASHQRVNKAELEKIRASDESMRAPAFTGRVPWRKLLLSGDMLGLFWMYFASGFGFLFFATWLPTYLMREHKLTLTQSGFYSALPLAAGAIGCAAGGALADWLTRRIGSVIWGRRIVGMGGFILGALGFAAAAFAGTPTQAILCLAFAAGAHDLTLPVAWATCVDIGGRFGGTASGYMNTASSIAGVLSPIAAAWLAQSFGSFHAMFAVAAAMYFAGGLLWLRINPATRLDE